MVALDVGFACTCQVSWGPDHLHQMEPQKKKNTPPILIAGQNEQLCRSTTGRFLLK